MESNESTGYANPPSETKFKPGKSGNPNGRPTGSRNRKTLAKWILSLSAEEVLPQPILVIMKAKYPDLADMSVEEVMHLAQIAKAIDKRDTQAYMAVLDSAYGRPTQAVELTGEGSGPLKVITYLPDNKRRTRTTPSDPEV